MNNYLRIFLLSILALFTEMFLIRWIGTEIRIFAYLQNLVLVTCFAGLGLGFIASSTRKQGYLAFLVPFTALIILICLPISRRELEDLSTYLTLYNNFHIWYAGVGHGLSAFILFISALILTALLLLLISSIFIPIGIVLGAELKRSENIVLAYGINLLGSLIGVWAFAASSWFYFGPVIWTAAVLLLGTVCFWSDLRQKFFYKLFLSSLCIIAILLVPKPEGNIQIIWSPYQKISLNQATSPSEAYKIEVNKVYYQNISKAPKPAELQSLSANDRGARVLLQANPENILIVGAGAGDSVAVALALTKANIVAVDIDPTIIDLGKHFHPDHPYSNPRVQIVIDDARSYFNHSKDKFDLILFDFLDAHTTASYSNIRLDHFVYTFESFAKARLLLEDSGIMAVSFAFDNIFLRKRILKTLYLAFNQTPLALGSFTFIVGALNSVQSNLSNYPKISVNLRTTENELKDSSSVQITNDNWPYLYLERHSIPMLYFILTGLALLVFACQARQLELLQKIIHPSKIELHFFLLGAAFMLLETTAILRLAVVYGNTWLVNAVAVSAILIMSYLATCCAEKKLAQQRDLVAVGLIFAALLYCFSDLNSLNQLSGIGRHFLIAISFSLPVYFSSLIFSSSLRLSSEPNLAFSYNLFGVIVGGLLANLSLLTGNQFLAYLIVGFYLLSLKFRPLQKVL